MSVRTVKDQLREEYFALLPEIKLVLEELEVEVRHCILPTILQLNPNEHVIVKTRVKECESAIQSLQKRQDGSEFNEEKPTEYSLTELDDLAGIRVLCFPKERIIEVDKIINEELLQKKYIHWNPDPVIHLGEKRAEKYSGFSSSSNRVRGEIQIVSMLTGLFWEVEHSALYKPTSKTRKILESPFMDISTKNVYDSLHDFEVVFETLIKSSESGQ